MTIDQEFDRQQGEQDQVSPQATSEEVQARDFGVKRNWGDGAADKFAGAMRKNVKWATITRRGTYRGDKVIHYVNSFNRRNVFTDLNHNFPSAWKLSWRQHFSVLMRGRLWFREWR